MKVICISNKDLSGGLSPFSFTYVEVGNEYTVLEPCIGYGINNAEVACFDLKELTHTDRVFDQRNFAILPDKSADEMSQESKEAIINIEQPINS